ncbi:MAG: hypothetical protein DHS20C03_25670 [Minwuia thermotolerans]|nr:MAG: hypothetical protein DHS20C03_25670 [Minwuia thermotolerans]
MKFKRRTLEQIADMICGNFETETSVFPYRSSSSLTEFFNDAETDYVHDGSTRKWWVASTLEKILAEPSSDARTPSDSFLRVVTTLMDQGDAHNEGVTRPKAIEMLNAALGRENLEAFYSEEGICFLRHTGSSQLLATQANPHRPLSANELERRERLEVFLEKCNEDQLIEEVLVALFRQLGFHRISVTGHKDKALEYGKDLWMRYVLPTQHVLYFGLQAKKGKLNASGRSDASNSNVAEILNQTTMMLGHEIFDPEVSRHVLVDHAIIACGGEITKAARNWLGTRLDASKRSQVMFMDRDDILNLYVVTNTPLPANALPPEAKVDDEIPF